jgi:Fe-S-cluster containining protein
VEGHVRLRDADIARLAAFLQLSEPEFIQQYTEVARDRRSLVLKDQANNACIFLANNQCRVYVAKPLQCGGFPLRWHVPGWEKWCQGARVIPVTPNRKQVDTA